MNRGVGWQGRGWQGGRSSACPRPLTRHKSKAKSNDTHTEVHTHAQTHARGRYRARIVKAGAARLTAAVRSW